MDAPTYRAQRERECAEVSAHAGTLQVVEQLDGEPKRWQLFGEAHLNDRARVQMLEVLEPSGTGIHRLKYAYYLVVDGKEVGGYERHPAEADPVHLHCTARDSGHVPGGTPCETVSFKQAVAHAWRWLSEHGIEVTGAGPTT